MAHTVEKIALGIIFLVLIGFRSYAILGQDNDVVSVKSEVAKISIPTTEGTTILAPLKEISKEQAKTIALSVAKGTIGEIEEKTAKGVTYYQVEIEDDTMETEIKINKYSGAILKVTKEEKDEEEEEIDPATLQTMSGVLTEEQAKAIALEHIEGTITGFEVERENGRLVYGVEMTAQGDVVEIEIDGETGEILEVEWGED